MRGSLVILAALCVIVAVEASSVRFVSIDEGQNGKDKKDRSEVSEGTDPVIKKRVEEVVKKISDGNDQSQKVVKSLDADRSSDAEKTSESAGEIVKKAASSEKPKVQKRDVKRALDLLSKRGMKRASAEDADAWNIFNARAIIIKYLTLQKSVVSKITASLAFAVERLEADQKEKESLLMNLQTFQTDLEQAYDKTINSLGSVPMPLNPQRKFTRADDIPALMRNVNQRNPLAIIPIMGRLISTIAGASSIVDTAASLIGTRSNAPDLAPLLEVIERFLPVGDFPTMPWDPDVSDY